MLPNALYAGFSSEIHSSLGFSVTITTLSILRDSFQTWILYRYATNACNFSLALDSLLICFQSCQVPSRPGFSRPFPIAAFLPATAAGPSTYTLPSNLRATFSVTHLVFVSAPSMLFLTPFRFLVIPLFRRLSMLLTQRLFFLLGSVSLCLSTVLPQVIFPSPFCSFYD